MTSAVPLAIAEELAGVGQWQTLAEPVYGIEGIGIAVRLPAGSQVQIVDVVDGIPGTLHAVARNADRADQWDEYSDVMVTASALRFEDGTPCVCGAPDCAERDDDGSIRVGDQVRVLPDGPWNTIDIVSENFVSVGGVALRRRLLARDMAEGRIEWRRGEVRS